MNPLKRWFGLPVYTQILVMMALGIVLGLVAGEDAAVLKPIGTAFLKGIKLVIVPLVFSSLVVGIMGVADPAKLGRIGFKTLGYFLVTTTLAITIGLVLANLVQPGSGVSEADVRALAEAGSSGAASVEAKLRAKPSAIDTLLAIIPDKPLASMVQGDMLPIIFFAVLFALAASRLSEEKHQVVYRFTDGVQDIMITIVNWVMLIAPYGVFAIIATVVGTSGVDILLKLAIYSLVVIVGLFLHATLVYGTAVAFIGRMSPLTFYKGIRPAQLLGFSTSSSSATLPVTMDCVRDDLKVDDEVVSFVLPLGATANMDGTALYQGVAALFIAQLYGFDLGIGEQLTIVLMATMASVGAAGVPGAGMITLAMVLEQLGVPLAGIGIIFGVDRILDMFRTAVNITGDSSACVVVDASERRRQAA